MTATVSATDTAAAALGPRHRTHRTGQQHQQGDAFQQPPGTGTVRAHERTDPDREGQRASRRRARHVPAGLGRRPGNSSAAQARGPDTSGSQLVQRCVERLAGGQVHQPHQAEDDPDGGNAAARRSSGVSEYTPGRIRKRRFPADSAEWPMSGHNNRPSGRACRKPCAPIVDGMHLTEHPSLRGERPMNTPSTVLSGTGLFKSYGMTRALAGVDYRRRQPASRWPSWARPAPASPPCCTAWPGSNDPTPARCLLDGERIDQLGERGPQRAAPHPRSASSSSPASCCRNCPPTRTWPCR